MERRSRPVIITASLLRRLLQCERLVWLDRHGNVADREAITLSLRVRYGLGIQHAQQVQQATLGTAQPVRFRSWTEGVAFTRQAMDRGVPAIDNGFIEAPLVGLPKGWPQVMLRGRPDQLVRLPRQGQHEIWQPFVQKTATWLNNVITGWFYKHGRSTYQVVEIKHNAEIGEADRLQLDFHLYVLQQMQGLPASGFFYAGRHSENGQRQKIPHSFNQERLLSYLRWAIAVLLQAEPPQAVIEHHCNGCQWQTACLRTKGPAVEIGFLPDLDKRSRLAMNEAGIMTVAQVAALSPERLREFPYIGEVRSVQLPAAAQAWVEQRPVWLDPVRCTRLKPGVMFDLETVSFSNEVWSIGWQMPGGESHNIFITPDRSMADLVADDGTHISVGRTSDEAWTRFAAAVQNEPVLYSWGSYDKVKLQASAPAEVQAALLERIQNLLVTTKRSVAFPIRKWQLAEVAGYLGFSWRTQDDCFDAHFNFKKWIAEGDLERLTRACIYQRDDVDALARIWKWLVNERTS